MTTAPQIAGATRIFHFPANVRNSTLYGAVLEVALDLGYTIEQRDEESYSTLVLRYNTKRNPQWLKCLGLSDSPSHVQHNMASGSAHHGVGFESQSGSGVKETTGTHSKPKTTGDNYTAEFDNDVISNLLRSFGTSTSSTSRSKDVPATVIGAKIENASNKNNLEQSGNLDTTIYDDEASRERSRVSGNRSDNAQHHFENAQNNTVSSRNPVFNAVSSRSSSKTSGSKNKTSFWNFFRGKSSETVDKNIEQRSNDSTAVVSTSTSECLDDKSTPQSAKTMTHTPGRKLRNVSDLITMRIENMERRYKILLIENVLDHRFSLSLDERLAMVNRGRSTPNNKQIPVSPSPRDTSNMSNRTSPTRRRDSPSTRRRDSGASMQSGFSLGTSLAEYEGSPSEIAISETAVSKGESSITCFEQDPRNFKRETSAYYFFTRLLTNANSGLAERAARLLSEFEQEFDSNLEFLQEYLKLEEELRESEKSAEDEKPDATVKPDVSSEANTPKEEKPLPILFEGSDINILKTDSNQAISSDNITTNIETKPTHTQTTEEGGPKEGVGTIPNESLDGETISRSASHTSSASVDLKSRIRKLKAGPLQLYKPFPKIRRIMRELELALENVKSQCRRTESEHLWAHKSSAVSKFVCSKTMASRICKWYQFRFSIEDAGYQVKREEYQKLSDEELFRAFDIGNLAGSYPITNSILNQCACEKIYFPTDLMERLISARTEMKLEVVSPLDGMDQILPLFICVLIRSEVKRPHMLAHLLLDWMSEEQQVESEGQIVTMFLSAACVVRNEKPF